MSHVLKSESPADRAAETRRKVNGYLDGPPPLIPLERQVGTSRLPLSFAQERIWFLDQLGLMGSVNNLAMANRLEGVLDVPALERSLFDLTMRHESLRTRFQAVEGNPYQVIEESSPYRLEVRDLSPLDESACNVAIRAAMQQEVAYKFDLSRGPLFRATLLRVAEHTHVLLLTM